MNITPVYTSSISIGLLFKTESWQCFAEKLLGSSTISPILSAIFVTFYQEELRHSILTGGRVVTAGMGQARRYHRRWIKGNE
jgi:hypothetical protein